MVNLLTVSVLLYRVTKVVVDLSWVDLYLGCCTFWLGQ